MSQTNNEKRKIAKRIARRKAYEKQRNRLHGRRAAKFYRQIKEKEAQDKKSQQKGKGIKGFFQNLFRGTQRGQ